MDAEYSRRGLTYILKADFLIFLLCVWMFLLIKFRVLLPLVVSWLMCKEHILSENLFSNINISVRNAPPLYFDFCRGNIKTIKDIWNVHNGMFYTEHYIQNKVAGSPNWRQKYRKLKANIPEGWINILKTNDTQTQTNPQFHINTELLLYRNDKFLEPNKLSFI